MAERDDIQRVDPFAPKRKIEMEQLPLPALKRWFQGNFEIERSQVPHESVPIFGIERGSARSLNRNIGNMTLPATAVWSSLTTPVTVTAAVTGLRDVLLRARGTAIASGSASTHGVSIKIDGTEYQQFVHSQATNAGNGMGLYTETLKDWDVWGLVPAETLTRGLHTFELVTKLTSGAATGTMFGDANNLINLYVLEQ